MVRWKGDLCVPWYNLWAVCKVNPDKGLLICGAASLCRRVKRNLQAITLSSNCYLPLRRNHSWVLRR